MKKVLLFCICIMLFSLCVNAKAKKKYLALGDSITYGYTLDNREEVAYAYKLAKKFDLELTNEAVVGDTTGDLLEALANYNIDDYDVITICIGANDLLHLISGLDSMDALNVIINALNDEEFNNKVDNILKETDENLKKIMDIVKSGHAQIYLMNVYHPFDRFSSEIVDKTVDHYVTKLNEVIDKYKDGTNFINLNKEFKKAKPVNINSQVARKGYTADPHPTEKGQQLIYELLKEQYEKNNVETVNIVLAIAFGIIALLVEVAEVIYTFKKFGVKMPKNGVITEENEVNTEEKKDSSRFIRS